MLMRKYICTADCTAGDKGDLDMTLSFVIQPALAQHPGLLFVLVFTAAFILGVIYRDIMQ